MSETMIAILIVPVLAALVGVLECTRVGCTMLHRKLRATRLGTPQEGQPGRPA